MLEGVEGTGIRKLSGELIGLLSSLNCPKKQLSESDKAAAFPGGETTFGVNARIGFGCEGIS